MSLIHEALERLEREKEGKVLIPEAPLPEPPAEEKQVLRPRESQRQNLRLIYGLGAGFVFLFVLGLVYLLITTFQTRLPQEGAQEISTQPVSSYGRYTLTGITQMGEGLTAIVNNQLVRTGESVDGARVTALTGEEVVLETAAGEVTLRI